MAWLGFYSVFEGGRFRLGVCLFEVLISDCVAVVVYLEIPKLLEDLLLSKLFQLQEDVFLGVF